MTLETQAAGVALFSYRCLPGHGDSNAAALEDSGLAPWARDVAALRTELVRALATPRRAVPAPVAPDLVTVVCSDLLAASR